MNHFSFVYLQEKISLQFSTCPVNQPRICLNVSFFHYLKMSYKFKVIIIVLDKKFSFKFFFQFKLMAKRRRGPRKTKSSHHRTRKPKSTRKRRTKKRRSKAPSKKLATTITSRTLRQMMMGPIQTKVGRRMKSVSLPMPRGRLLY